MSRSKRKFPAGKNIWESKKEGKRICHRLFRQRERMAMRTGNERELPFRQWQIMDPWDLHDGRFYFGHWNGRNEWYDRLMRK